MSADYFLDTNIVVYAFDRRAEEKRKKALELMAPEQPWQISWQVIQEFCSVALHRFAIPLSQDFLSEYLESILLPHCRVMSSARIYQEAVRIQRNTQYRYYDSLIVTSALSSGASILYSEDLQHSRVIGDLRIVNPFI
ncbi:MAG: PIN domain-containing protein [Luteolibacter sp.]